ncbi:hypothetical protein [Neptunitalea lumnitzerae]|uniref:Uncharacterized protein n=1 Tax=Neptunitalea lumnitzerae TaxID=2965509 RepID=A0ABQ5MES5_9FLAO|nr:hypothetical protein [Neptunitalea sp. Y10]GLB47868.1 hypothetical protein Y10_02360 [Neptunitalea sp. Y10]
MAVYIEKSGKLVMKVNNDHSEVMLKLNTYHGTIATVSFYDILNNEKMVHYGGKIQVGTGKQLKGKTIVFVGASGNPDGGQIKIEHLFLENNIAELEYTFPNHYTGSPAVEPQDEQPTYIFTVTFI